MASGQSSFVRIKAASVTRLYPIIDRQFRYPTSKFHILVIEHTTFAYNILKPTEFDYIFKEWPLGHIIPLR